MNTKLILIACSLTLPVLAMSKKSPQADLIEAIQKDDFEICRALLLSGAQASQKNSTGQPALSVAIMYASTELVELLLKYNADVNWADNRGQTPLHYAAAMNKCVPLLIAHKAEVNRQCDKGYTPLMQAAAFGRPVVVSYLLKAGSSLEIKDLHGDRALEIAKFFNALSMKKSPSELKKEQDEALFYHEAMTMLEVAHKKNENINQ